MNTENNNIGDSFKEAMRVYRLTEPWNLQDILKQLVEATDKLLIDKGYDGHDYEEMEQASKFAKEIINEIPEILRSIQPITIDKLI